MSKKLTFTITIDAPRRRVWDAMLEAETYSQWTSPFCDGSHYVGSWQQGAKIRFLAPNGDGMVAEIAENRPLEYVSIRHIGEIKNGVEDTTSEAVRAWTPAYENYIFAETKNGSKVTVELDTRREFEKYILETYPKALGILKELCETARDRHEPTQ